MVNIVGKEMDVTYFVSENRGVDGKLKSKPTIVKKVCRTEGLCHKHCGILQYPA